MKRHLPKRMPSPALVLSAIALFVSLGGVSYGVATGFIDSREIKNNTVRTQDLRNNDVRGKDIRNGTIHGRDVQNQSLTGDDINENRLGKVPTAALADQASNATSLGGTPAAGFLKSSQVIPFNVALEAADGERVLATNGNVSVSARCYDNDGGNDRLRILAKTTTQSGTVMDGLDDYDGTGGTPFLEDIAGDANRELAVLEAANNVTSVGSATGSGFVMGSDGKGIRLIGDATSLMLNLPPGAGKAGCRASGVLHPFG